MPHASYLTCGHIVASALKTFTKLPHASHRVYLIGHSHDASEHRTVLFDGDSLCTPLGPIRIDTQTVGKLASQSGLAVDRHRFDAEQSILAILPFMQIILGDFLLVPILVGPDSTPKLIECLIDEARLPNVLVFASSDLSHGLNEERARKTDAIFIRSLLRNADVTEVPDAVPTMEVAPALVLHKIAAKLGWDRYLEAYDTSALLTGPNYVVGYAGITYYG